MTMIFDDWQGVWRLLPGAMRAQRVTEAEIHAAIRQSGHHSLDETRAVVLETDGSLSVT